MPQLLDLAKDGQASFFIQFGGQGSPYIKELVKLYAEPHLKDLFEAGFAGINACLDDPTVKSVSHPLPQGLDIKSWLENPDSMPDDGYLSSAPVSVPLIGFTQIAHFANLVHNGYAVKDLLAATKGLTGHSQGIIPAALVGLGFEGQEFIDNAAKFIRFLFYIGFRSQQNFPEQNNKDGIGDKSTELGDKNLSPMAAILGATAEQIADLLKDYNAKASEEDKLHISLYNMPESSVVSGKPSSLLAWREQVKPKMDEAGIKLVYVRTTCPFHCPLMKDTEEIFLPDLETIGFNFSGADLKVPLYSIYDGHDYKAEENLGLTLFREMVIMELNWDKAIAKLINSSEATHCLDFGPGKVSQRLTQSWLGQKEIPVLSAAVPKDVKTLLA